MHTIASEKKKSNLSFRSASRAAAQPAAALARAYMALYAAQPVLRHLFFFFFFLLLFFSAQQIRPSRQNRPEAEPHAASSRAQAATWAWAGKVSTRLGQIWPNSVESNLIHPFRSDGEERKSVV
jgi:ABC-type amino acid transport system permease subunit